MKENENDCSENDPGPSHNEAFECLGTAMKCFERQKNADPIQLTYLRRIRDSIEKNVFFEESNNRKLFCFNARISVVQKMIKREKENFK